MFLNQRIARKTLIFLVVFAAVLVGIGLSILSTGEVVQKNPGIVATFLINISICFVMLIKAVRKYAYSFNMMFWLFGLFFFGIAPMLQYISDTYAWTLVPQASEILRTNIYILLWLCCYSLGGSINKKIKFSLRSVVDRRKQQYSYRINQRALNCLLVVSILITAYNIYSIGLLNLFVLETNNNADLDGPMSLLVMHGFRNTVLFTLVLSILCAKSRGRMGYEPILAAICCLLSCAPTGITRNMMASFYGGLLIILLANGTKKRWIIFAIIGGIVVVFPAINIFRRLSTVAPDKILETVMSSIRNTYLAGDYDAHQMFISVQRWVEQDGLQYGRQLIGAILFFVPRLLWPEKPLGTGRSAFEATNQFWFTNVSAPLVSEAWVNFGAIGIIVFAVILGYTVKQVDVKYWQANSECSLIRIVYPFLMFMFFFMQRGDLMSTWAYFFAQMVIGMFIYKFAVKKVNKI